MKQHPRLKVEQRSRHQSSQGHRRERLERLAYEELGALLREDLDDPALEGLRLVHLEVSVDYRNLRAYCLVPGPSAPVEEALARATPFLRGQLTESLHLKFSPQLRFSVAQRGSGEPVGPLVDHAEHAELVGDEAAAPPEAVREEV